MSVDATVAPTVSKSTPTKQPIKLSVSGILLDLENGLDRTAIATKYGLTSGEVAEVFKHPKLKNKRPNRKVTRITLIDDTEEDGTFTSALVAEGNGEESMADIEEGTQGGETTEEKRAEENIEEAAASQETDPNTEMIGGTDNVIEGAATPTTEEGAGGIPADTFSDF